MSAALLELLHSPGLRMAMGEAGREKVERQFTPAQMKQKLEDLYDRVLREHRPTARVLQIGNYPPPVCGWSLHTQLVHETLKERGADSRVVDIGPGRRITGRDCIPVHGALDYAAKLLLYRLRGFTFHVHVNGDSHKGYLLALAAVALGRLTGKPSVLTFHAGPQQIYFPRPRGVWYRAFQLLFRLSGRIICNHQPVKRLIANYGVPEHKIEPIPAFSVQYSEEVPAPLPAAVDEFLSAHSPRLFCYAMSRPEFTLECLFEAFAALRREFPNAGLLMTGGQDVPPELKSDLQRLGIADAVLFAGNLPHAEFLTAVQHSDAFVRTHLRDGVCSSVLEALHLGVPVVAAEDGHRPPSVFKYAPGDADDLLRVLTGVLRDLRAARAEVRPPEVRDNLNNEVNLLLTAGSRA
jgi:glycosyltransferase involved in cell wall biosynthesis